MFPSLACRVILKTPWLRVPTDAKQIRVATPEREISESGG